MMKKALWENVYESMACHAQEPFRFPGVEDAFANESYCMQQYRKMRDAYDRLCDRLGVVDEERDVECIIQCYEEIQRELCRRMFQYGQMLTFTKFS